MSKERWVEETFHPHWRVRLKADEVLHEVKTEHQHLVIFKNETWGTVLMLDGVCQLTTSDEFVYHEMMAHVPLMALNKPKRVLVVGGGDGGVLREVLKHDTVTKATLCEIDRTVVDTALEHYPEIANGCFDDPRSDIVIARPDRCSQPVAGPGNVDVGIGGTLAEAAARVCRRDANGRSHRPGSGERQRRCDNRAKGDESPHVVSIGLCQVVSNAGAGGGHTDCQSLTAGSAPC